MKPNYKLGAQVDIERLREALAMPARRPNPDYRKKRWFEFWVWQQPEFFEADASYRADLKSIVQAYDEVGGTLYEYSTFHGDRGLEGEFGYILLRDDQEVARLVVLQS